MHRFSPFCPMFIDGNITRDSFLWTKKKAAILPDIAYFWCGATRVWSLKGWMTFDSPYPIISAKSHLQPCWIPSSRQEGWDHWAAQKHKISAKPWRKCLWDELLQDNPVLQWNHNIPYSTSGPLYDLESICQFKIVILNSKRFSFLPSFKYVKKKKVTILGSI